MSCPKCGAFSLPVDNAWVAVDLDGTILKPAYPNLGEPIVGAREGLEQIKDMGFKVMLWTARLGLTDEHGKFQNFWRVCEGIKQHLSGHKIPYDYILPQLHKPSFVFAYVDDKAIPVDGRGWPGVISTMQDRLAILGVPWFGDKRPYLKQLAL